MRHATGRHRPAPERLTDYASDIALFGDCRIRAIGMASRPRQPMAGCRMDERRQGRHRDRALRSARWRVNVHGIGASVAPSIPAIASPQ